MTKWYTIDTKRRYTGPVIAGPVIPSGTFQWAKKLPIIHNYLRISSTDFVFSLLS